MGKSLEQNSVWLKKTTATDRLDAENWANCILCKMPDFYFHEECHPVPIFLIPPNDRLDPLPNYDEDGREDIDYTAPPGLVFLRPDEIVFSMPLADMDLLADEHDQLEDDFDLESLTRDDGFVLVCLPRSLYAIVPWDVPLENEENILEDFHFTASDQSSLAILCEYSRIS